MTKAILFSVRFLIMPAVAALLSLTGGCAHQRPQPTFIINDGSPYVYANRKRPKPTLTINLPPLKKKGYRIQVDSETGDRTLYVRAEQDKHDTPVILINLDHTDWDPLGNPGPRPIVIQTARIKEDRKDAQPALAASSNEKPGQAAKSRRLVIRFKGGFPTGEICANELSEEKPPADEPPPETQPPTR